MKLVTFNAIALVAALPAVPDPKVLTQTGAVDSQSTSTCHLEEQYAQYTDNNILVPHHACVPISQWNPRPPLQPVERMLVASVAFYLCDGLFALSWQL